MTQERERDPSVSSVSNQEVNLYEVKLTPEEADEYFRQVRETLASASENPYKNIMEKLRGHLAKNHRDNLAKSYGILLPLTLQECVKKGQTSEVTIENLQWLLMEVGFFLSRFKNTGVKLIGSPPPELVNKYK